MSVASWYALARRLDHTRWQDYQALVLSDYGKGFFTPAWARKMLEQSHAQRPWLVDPAAGRNWKHYMGATVIKPNRAEAEQGGRELTSPKEAMYAAEALVNRYELDTVVITLDSDGVASFTRDQPHVHIPARPRHVLDVTGAGDMALAMLSLCYASGIRGREALWLANIAAGAEVEGFGSVPINRALLEREIDLQLKYEAGV